jgi:2-dehydro-3-deoxygluconokinase
VTRLPANPIGDGVVRALRAEGVRTEHIAPRRQPGRDLFHRDGRRASARPPSIYDRAHSAISEIPARRGRLGRGDGGRGVVPRHRHHARARRARGGGDQGGVAAARRAGAQVSVDLNFRKKLWTEAQAQAVMRR